MIDNIQEEKEIGLLTEYEVTREWRRLFGHAGTTAAAIKEGAALVEQLPLDSPLRARYSRELSDLRSLLLSESQSEKS